jgi:hypothetical protein
MLIIISFLFIDLVLIEFTHIFWYSTMNLFLVGYLQSCLSNW